MLLCHCKVTAGLFHIESLDKEFVKHYDSPYLPIFMINGTLNCVSTSFEMKPLTKESFENLGLTSSQAMKFYIWETSAQKIKQC